MTLAFHVGSKNFIRFFWVSWEVFVLHGNDCIHCVATSCTTAAYRWLFRDSLSSLSTFWSAVIKSPKCSALLLQEALIIFVFKHIPQIGSFGKCVHTLCLPEPGSTFARCSIGSSWDDLEVSRLPCTRFPQGFVEVFSSTKFSLNSCSQSGNSCGISLCTSSDSPFIFWFSISVDSCSGSHRSSSPTLRLLSGTGFSVYLLTSNTESCDEDDGEAGEGVVEEELADQPRTINGT